jgi:ABC-2 type transport system permease protein
MSAYALTDSMTMLRRNLRRAQRYPGMTISTVATPVLMLLLFAGVFGTALGAGISGGMGAGTGGVEYIDYLTPGVLLMAATSGSVATAVSVSMDATDGIMNRFRTMAIARSSILTGQVIGGVLQTMASLALVVVVALLMGFSPDATAVEWLLAVGILTLMTFALTWLAAALGLVAKGPEQASNWPLPVTFLPLLGSGFVPTDSMPAGVRQFAEYQPFTPIIETLRGLLMGSRIGNSGWIAIGWCVLISVGGFWWARAAFVRAANRPG